MLSAKEKAFVEYWQEVREKEGTFKRKLLAGIPMAALFGLPVILLVVVIYLFFPEWYTKVSDTSSGTFIAMIVAVLIIVLFFSYFRMHFKWEMNEQLFNELLAREKREIK